jgi:hypothetical protein
MTELKKSKEEIMDKAEQLGIEYEAKYKGCCPATFYAVVDALRWGGLDIVPEKLADDMYDGICLLTAGGCMTGEGTCGAVVAGMITSGFAFGQSSDLRNPPVADKAGAQVRDTLLEKFYLDYRSILCKDVMRKYFGKAWNLTSREMTQEFLGITDGCVIRKTARLIAGIILDKYEKGELKIPA